MYIVNVLSFKVVMEGDVLFFSSHGASGGLRVVAWEPSSGTARRTYGCEVQGGAASLALLGRTHLLCALRTIPYIYVWNLKKEHVELKMSCPGVVRALDITPDRVYCVGCIADKLYVWQIATGHLLAVSSQHYQPISTVRLSDDGRWVITGGEDARVLVWSLRRLLSEAYDSNDITLPHCEGLPLPTLATSHPPASPVRHTWADHSLPVTDVFCGTGGGNARVATVSLDQTCKLYELSSGHLLCSLLFGFSLTSVTMDAAEQWLFVGGATGRIAQVNLFVQRTNPAHDVADSIEMDDRYNGHTKAVQGLLVSSLGSHLFSCSEDGSCRAWDIFSGQAVKIHQIKGPITNSLLCWNPVLSGVGSADRGQGREGVERGRRRERVEREREREGVVTIAPFQKQLFYAQGEIGDWTVPVLVGGEDPLCDLSTLPCETVLSSIQLQDDEDESREEDSVMELHRLKKDMTQLREVNRRLYTMLSEQTST